MSLDVLHPVFRRATLEHPLFQHVECVCTLGVGGVDKPVVAFSVERESKQDESIIVW